MGHKLLLSNECGHGSCHVKGSLCPAVPNMSAHYQWWLGDGAGVGKRGQWQKSVELRRHRWVKQLLNHLAWTSSSPWIAFSFCCSFVAILPSKGAGDLVSWVRTLFSTVGQFSFPNCYIRLVSGVTWLCSPFIFISHTSISASH